ncbi:hypothetical protein ES707_22885 [subsurface metagenome]
MENPQLISDAQRLTESLEQVPEPVAKPVLIAVSGLPGTGKSYFCSKLAERLPFIVLESDTLRKALFPSPSYSSQESSHLFQTCHYLIEQLLKRGFCLILDATNLLEGHREYLYSIAERLDVKLILVQVKAPPQVVRERLRDREKSATKSDADWSVYRKMKSSVQPIRRNHYVVDTSRDITPVVNKIVKMVGY